MSSAEPVVLPVNRIGIWVSLVAIDSVNSLSPCFGVVVAAAADLNGHSTCSVRQPTCSEQMGERHPRRKTRKVERAMGLPSTSRADQRRLEVRGAAMAAQMAQ